jgi:hypothetical protein
MNNVVFERIDAILLLSSSNLDDPDRAQHGAVHAVGYKNTFGFNDRCTTGELTGCEMGMPSYLRFTDAHTSTLLILQVLTL